MRAAVLATVAALAFGGSAFAAQKAKPPSPAHKPCSGGTVSALLSKINGAEKILVSPALDADQYKLLRKSGQEMTKSPLPGDGAVIAGFPGSFRAILTEGSGDSVQVCAMLRLPEEFVDLLVGLQKSAPAPKPDDSSGSHFPNPKAGEGV